MEEKISKLKYFTITFTVCVVLIFNFLEWSNPTIGGSFGLIYILFYSFILGSLFVNKQAWQVIFGLLFFLATIGILGALLIYFYQFNDYVFILLLLAIPAFLIIPYYHLGIRKKFSFKEIIKDYLNKFDERREPKSNSILVIIYLVLASGSFFLLFKGQTIESIQAPWQVVNGLFFPLYFLTTAVLLIYLFNSHRTKLPLGLIAAHTFLSSSVALIVYKIGYGFDPFIHQATEKIIALNGTISPKPLYYLGQYALVVFFHKLTAIDISLIDRALVPTLFSLFLPAATFYVFSHWLKKNYSLVLALTILVIPYSGFIMTAPQNLANLFFIITILLSLLYFRNQLSIFVLYFLSLAVLATHPLAGIPLLITVILFNLFKLLYKSYVRYLSLYFFTALVFILFLPLAFIINGSTINFKPHLALADFKWFDFIDKFDLALNLV